MGIKPLELVKQSNTETLNHQNILFLCSICLASWSKGGHRKIIPIITNDIGHGIWQDIQHYIGNDIQFPLAPMGVLAHSSAHARPSAQPHIDTSGNFSAKVSGRG